MLFLVLTFEGAGLIWVDNYCLSSGSSLSFALQGANFCNKSMVALFIEGRGYFEISVADAYMR